MSSRERRLETRLDLRIPLQFRPVTSPPSRHQAAESINLSQRGLCFATEIPLKVGTQVEIFMKIPSEISGNPTCEVRCIARVMHCKSGWMSEKAAVGLRVEKIETLTASERWIS